MFAEPLALGGHRPAGRCARPPLAGDLDVDVAIVGAGFTGLWTAYYLAEADPSLRIVVLEAEIAGFGASGRNGGWCSALFPASLSSLAGAGRPRVRAGPARRDARHGRRGRPGARRRGHRRPLRQGRHDHAGPLPAQLARARAEVDDARSWGRGEDDVRLLDADEARDALAATGVLGATYTPDCAAIHPLRLVRGLADAVERRGVRLHEHTRCARSSPAGRPPTAASSGPRP